MKFSAACAKLPTLSNSLFAVLSAILLVLSFPDFDFWFLAWVSLVPLFFAVEREKQSVVKSFVLGWTFGVVFFFGSCWWLTYAPTTYGGVPAIISYALLFGVTLVAGFFPAIFAALFSVFLKRFGSLAILSAPFLWTATEFLRFWITGNNWNAIGYSQAFSGNSLRFASVGGVYLVGFVIVFVSVFFIWLQRYLKKKFGVGILPFKFPGLLLFPQNKEAAQKVVTEKQQLIIIALFFAPLLFSIVTGFALMENRSPSKSFEPDSKKIFVVAVQPNVPMSDLKYGEWENLQRQHVELAENALRNTETVAGRPTIVVFPESPMNFEYESDRALKAFLRDFAVRNNASVLFNSAQPNTRGTNLFNSAVMINTRGEKVGQYDKIHLVPFGETVPVPEPLAQFVPTMVGNFETGANYNLFPLGNDIKAGVMICFESHFPSLSREYARQGADVLIEMTNDGYLGKTPILRQHLANAVFRAVETNRPFVRVTNVGITAFINERGEVLDALDSYTQGAKVWTISKSSGAQTFYVRFGDWFAWICSITSLALLFFSFRKRKFNDNLAK